MYSRKVKKKKSNSSYGSSGWGPRIALEEQEQQQQASGKSSYGQALPRTSVFKNPYANVGNNGSSGFILCPKGPREREPLNKPLTVVIPSSDIGNSRYDYAGHGYRAEDSLPSTETWQSSATEDQEDEKRNNESNYAKDLETIEVSMPNILVASNNSRSSTSTPESRMSRDFRESGSRKSQQRTSVTEQAGTSSITSAHGITMVYVPMERSKMNPKPLHEQNYDVEQIMEPSIEANLLANNGSSIPLGSGSVKDGDVDSLLESFDSVIFKPKFSVGGSSSGLGSGSSNQGQNNQPPALPPKNKNMGQGKKSLRFSDFLEIEPKSPFENKVLNKDPGSEDLVDTDTILSCGHARDNYSTLSSIASSKGSFTERPGATTAAMSEVSEKSALQQLRDLSILIGGSFHEPDVPEPKCSPPEDVKTRKSSTATSADSGKGSAGTEASSMLELNNNTIGHGSCACTESNNNCLFHPECEECLTFFKNPLEAPPLLPKEIQCVETKRKASFSARGNLKRKSKFTKNPKTKLKASKPFKDHLEFEYCDCAQCDCRCAKGKGKQMGKGLTKTQVLSGKQDLVRTNLSFENHTFHVNAKGLTNFDSLNEAIRKQHLVPGSRCPGIHSDALPLDAHLFTIAEEDERRYEYGLLRQRSQGGVSPSPDEERRANHLHPKCWLAPDPNMGWSDLESLYSQNMKRKSPLDINGECWTCWEELSRFKRNSPETSNTTMDRTKRMFIWLNKRPKEFNAPWWDAKKKASIKWLIVKALPQLRKDSIHLMPFRESKKDRTKLRLKEEVTSGLISGKLYTMAMFNLYHQTRSDTALEQQLANNLRHGGRLTLWEIIRILSRKGIYVAQPSDMKLTEGTLRQRKPLRIAAHIALIEALMCLYAKELLCRDRICMILSSYGHTLGPETLVPEQLVISWINATVTTIQAYILATNKLKKTISIRLHRWLRFGPAEDIRDLSDGVGVSALLVYHFAEEVSPEEIAVPEPGETLNLYETTSNHALIERLVRELIPEPMHHLSLTDFLYVHGHMKQNLLAFLIDLFTHLELRPGPRVNRLAF